LDYLHVKASESLSLKIEAEDKIRKDEKIRLARKLIKRKLTNEEIAENTGLTVGQINALRDEEE